MKYYTEEFVTLKDGSVASALFERASYKDALMAYHQSIASIMANNEVEVAYVAVRNSVGGVLEEAAWNPEKIEN